MFSIFRKQSYDYRKVIITLRCKSKYMQFLQQLHKERIAISNLVIHDKEIEFSIALKDLQKIRRLRRKYKVQLSIFFADSNPIIVPNSLTLFGLFLLWLIPFCCQFFIWGYTIEAETPEREVEVRHIIQNWSFPILHSNMQSEHEIRQKILGNMQDVSWAFVEKSGAKLKLKIEEAPKTNVEAHPASKNLYAKQAGVISHYFIESGVKSFTLNETVKKGQLLVSAELISGEKSRFIPVRGQVFADFWRTVTFTLPRTINYSVFVERKWKVGTMNSNEQIVTTLSFLDWLPEKWKFRQINIMKNEQIYLSEDHIDTFILPLVKEKTLTELSEQATIASEKLLHVTFDNDTVKGQVLYLVNDNIAVTSPRDEGE